MNNNHNNYKKILLITLLTPLLALADDPLPADFGPSGDPNPVDAPIDVNLWILVVAGIIFIGYKLYCKKKISI